MSQKQKRVRFAVISLVEVRVGAPEQAWATVYAGMSETVAERVHRRELRRGRQSHILRRVEGQAS